MSSAEKIIRILYATIAFACALALHLCGAPSVLAQSDMRPYTEENRLYNRLDRIDSRLDSEDAREQGLKDELSHIEGIGEGGMVALGILQTIGLITKLKNRDE